MQQHKNLAEQMQKRGLWDVDQFPLKDWGTDNRQAARGWSQFSQDFLDSRPQPEDSFNFRNNIIDRVVPFVNKRGVRKRPFKGEEHEVKLTQVDNIPGCARLVYRNHEERVGAFVECMLHSHETVQDDIQKVGKLLHKKAKKALRGKR